MWKWKDYSIRYQCSGENGPALVLIHGFGANRSTFASHYKTTNYIGINCQIDHVTQTQMSHYSSVCVCVIVGCPPRMHKSRCMCLVVYTYVLSLLLLSFKDTTDSGQPSAQSSFYIMSELSSASVISFSMTMICLQHLL